MTAYTDEMVEVLVETVEANDGKMSQELSRKMAEMPIFRDAGKTARSIVAKANTLKIPYEKIERPVSNVRAHKETIVAELESLTGIEDLASLRNVKVGTLEALVDWART